jgi:tetratricopeptide (TPR) repeat protein
MDNTEKAITWIKHLEKNHYLSPSDYNNIAWILYEEKWDLKYSADLLRKSVKGDPTILAAWKNLQCVLGDLMEIEEGIVVSDQALKYYPDDPMVIMNRAKFLFMSGNIRECTSYMMKELSRVFGGNIPVSEIEETMNQSFMNAGIKDLESFEKLFKAALQIERSKIKK